MYAILKKEMFINNVKGSDIANAIGKNEETVSRKINGHSDFTIGEAWAIQQKFFPGLNIEYLFRQEEPDSKNRLCQAQAAEEKLQS